MLSQWSLIQENPSDQYQQVISRKIQEELELFFLQATVSMVTTSTLLVWKRGTFGVLVGNHPLRASAMPSGSPSQGLTMLHRRLLIDFVIILRYP